MTSQSIYDMITILKWKVLQHVMTKWSFFSWSYIGIIRLWFFSSFQNIPVRRKWMKEQQKKFAGHLLKQRYRYVFTFYESKYSFIVLQMHNYIIYNQAKDKYKRKTLIEGCLCNNKEIIMCCASHIFVNYDRL